MSDSVQPQRRQPTRLPRPWDSPGKNAGVGCHFLLQCMTVKSEREVAQSCLTLSDPMDCSSPGSSVHGIFQARVPEWGAIAFSAGQVNDTIIHRAGKSLLSLQPLFYLSLSHLRPYLLFLLDCDSAIITVNRFSCLQFLPVPTHFVYSWTLYL